MKENYGTDSKDVIACIGPSICMSCYEISEDVANEFKMAFPDNIDNILWIKEMVNICWTYGSVTE